MRQAAPKATPPASSRRGEREKNERGGAADAANAANATTPKCVLLGALPSPFGSAASSSTTTPGSSSSDAVCRVTTRRQSRLSAAAAAANAAAVNAAAAVDAMSLAPAAAAAASLKSQLAAPSPPRPPQPPQPLLTDSLFAPLASGLELRTRSSISLEDKVTASSATPLDPSPSLLNPETFAFSRAFDFDRVIGRSELSEVWLARHKVSGKLFAVKRSTTTAAAAQGAAAAVGASACSATAAALPKATAAARSRMTASEVSVVASVPPHPNLVGVLRSWREVDAGSFLQMDYCRGGSLAEAIRRAVKRSRRIRRRKSSSGGGSDDGGKEETPSPDVPAALPEAAVWRVAAHVSSALEALHAARVIHMDVKPENVYLDWKEEGKGKENPVPAVVLRLGDFGLSVSNDAEDDEQSEGAPWEEGDGRYVAPELLSGSSVSSSRPTPAADVFSLGAALFECATGRPPPRGGAAASLALSPGAVAAAVVASLAPGSSSSAALLADLIASAMLPDPRSRPPAAHLARAAAEEDSRCRGEAGGEENADWALTAGLFLRSSGTAAGGGAINLLGSAPSFSLLRRSDARRRGYTLDGSLSLSIDDDDEAENKKKKNGQGDASADEDFDDDEADALFFSRPPSAPRAGHSRRRTPRSAPSSPGEEKKKASGGSNPPLLSPPPLLLTTATIATAPAAARPPLAPLSIGPLVEEMSIGEVGEGEGEESGKLPCTRLDLERALSSMSIDGVGATGGGGENGFLLSPGSPARACSPWPAAAFNASRAPPATRVPPAPQRREEATSLATAAAAAARTNASSTSSRRFGFFGLPAPPPPPPPSASFDEQLSVDGLGDTVRQLSMSSSGRDEELLLPSLPPLPQQPAVRLQRRR